MARYHLTPDGPKVCSARLKCDYEAAAEKRGETVEIEHYPNKAAADAAYAKQLAEQNKDKEDPKLRKDDSAPKEEVLEEKKDSTDDVNAIETKEELPPRIFEISDDKMKRLEMAIAKANNRLKGYGIEGRFEYEATPFQRVETDASGGKTMKSGFQVTLNHPRISYNGYKFLARVEEVGEGNFIAYSAPGVEMGGWRPNSITCEHCGKVRNRSKVYVVEDENGDRKIVGGSCLQAYTGVPVQGLFALEYDIDPTDEESEYYGGFHVEHVEDRDELLKLAYATVEEEGYKSVQNYNQVSSAKKVGIALKPNSKNKGEIEYAEHLYELANKLDADKIRAEVLESLEGNDSSWATNIRTLMNSEHTRGKDTSLLISSMAAVQRFKKQQEEKKRRKPFVSGYLGDPDTKVSNVKARVLNVAQYDSDYGGYYGPSSYSRVTMQTEDGHLVVVNTTASKIPEKGQDVEFNASIKKHATTRWNDNEVDTTYIKRPKWLSMSTPDENPDNEKKDGER